MSSPRSGSDTRFALSLALITLLAPTATDMYLASMPDIAKHMNASYAAVQITLTVFLMAQGAGQLFFGPIIDRFGRRGPLLWGIAAFIASSLWAASADSLTILTISRFMQGLSGALLLVIGFSSISDVASGPRAAGLFAVLLTIEGLAPIFAPIAGGYVDALFGWRAVLLASAAMGAAAFANSFFSLPETLAKDKRIPLRPAVIASTYKRILMDRNFLLPCLALAALFFYLFAYIAGGAYLYQTEFGLSPDTFGLIFGGSGSAVMLGAFLSSKLVKTRRVSFVALCGLGCIIAGTAVAGLSSFSSSLAGIVCGFVIALFGLGMAEPTLVAMTMALQKTALGFTAALMGAFHLMLASLSTPISGYLLPLGRNYWFAFLFFSSLATFALAFWAGRARYAKARARAQRIAKAAHVSG